MTATFTSLALTQLKESPLNPRKHFAPGPLQELAVSLKASGQLEPVLVRPVNGSYELLAGHRRFRAAQLAGLTHLDAKVQEVDDQTAVEILTISNLQRDDLHPLEEAQGFADLVKHARYDVAKIAARIGKSEKYVYDRLKLLQLIPAAKKLFTAGAFDAGHAILLARLTKEQQERVLGDVQEAADGDHRASLLFNPQRGGDNEELPLQDQVKPVTVRELQYAIDRHIRATPETVDPFLFPASAAALAAAKEEKLAVVHITRDHLVHDDARDEKVRTYGGTAWERADGQAEPDPYGEKPVKSKTCDFSRYGMVVAGPGRGEVFKVCINREKCATHWPEQAKAAARRKKAAKKDATAGGTKHQEKAAEREKRDEVKRKQEQQDAEARKARWMKAGPALVGRLVEELEKMSAKLHVRTLLNRFTAERWDKAAHRLQEMVPSSTDALPRIVATMLLDEVGYYGFERDILKVLQHVGLKAKDVQQIVDAAVPPPAKAKPEGNIVLTKGKRAKGKKAKGSK